MMPKPLINFLLAKISKPINDKSTIGKISFVQLIYYIQIILEIPEVNFSVFIVCVSLLIMQNKFIEQRWCVIQIINNGLILQLYRQNKKFHK